MSDSNVPSTPVRLNRKVILYVRRALALILATLAIALLALVVFAGSREYSRSGHSTWFEHGWPWVFGLRPIVRDESRLTFWIDLRDLHLWSLVGDTAIFLAATMGIGLLAYKVSVASFQFTMRRMGVAMLLLCLALGYFANLLRGSARDNRVVESVDTARVSFDWEYGGPRWLVRITGNAATFQGVFDRAVSASLWSPSDEEVPYIATSLSQLPELKELHCRSFDEWSDPHIRMILSAKERWQLTTLFIAAGPVTSYGLDDIDRCPDLKVAVFDYTDVDDRLVMKLSRCRDLEVLSLIGTQITGESIDAFEEMKQLKELDLLKCNRLTDADVARLEKLSGVDVHVSNK